MGHQLLQIGVAVVEEDADLPGHQAPLLADPDHLTVMELGLHTVPGHPDAEIGPVGHLTAHLYHFIVLPVQKLARPGGDSQGVQRQTAQRRLLTVTATVPQKLGVIHYQLPALPVQPGEQPLAPAGENAPDIIHSQRVAQGQELPGIGQGGAVLPLGDSLVGKGEAHFIHAGGQLRLVHPQLLAPPGNQFADTVIHQNHLFPLFVIWIIQQKQDNCNPLSILKRESLSLAFSFSGGKKFSLSCSTLYNKRADYKCIVCKNRYFW